MSRSSPGCNADSLRQYASHLAVLHQWAVTGQLVTARRKREREPAIVADGRRELRACRVHCHDVTGQRDWRARRRAADSFKDASRCCHGQHFRRIRLLPGRRSATRRSRTLAISRQLGRLVRRPGCAIGERVAIAAARSRLAAAVGNGADASDTLVIYCQEHSADRPGRVDAPGVHVHRAGLFDLFRGYDACR